jgi:hypothetical protein
MLVILDVSPQLRQPGLRWISRVSSLAQRVQLGKVMKTNNTVAVLASTRNDCDDVTRTFVVRGNHAVIFSDDSDHHDGEAHCGELMTRDEARKLWKSLTDSGKFEQVGLDRASSWAREIGSGELVNAHAEMCERFYG